MSTYNAEEEQVVEAIKGWWRKYGVIAVVTAVILTGGYLGWDTYSKKQLAQLGNISDRYSILIEELAEKGLDEQTSVQTFIDQNSTSNYSILASLTLAKYMVDAEKLDDALVQLQWAKSNNKDTTMDALIANRIARVLMGLEKYEEAINELTAVQDPVWQARNQELIGDIYLIQENRDSALAAYQKAQDTYAAASQQVSSSLQMKLDDLAK